MRRILALIIIACAGLLSMSSAHAQERPHYHFKPVPPGTIVQNVAFNPAGASMHGRWRAVASRRLLGTAHKQAFYQWYLSFYRLGALGNYRLAMRSPGKAPTLLSTVKKVPNAAMWFPSQQVKIIGAASLTGTDAQQLVVASHESAADCGSAAVTIFGFDVKHQTLVPLVSMRNPCDLTATLPVQSAGNVVNLIGPAYAKYDPLCCPSQPKAHAVLFFQRGKWRMTPSLYSMKLGSYFL